MAVSESTDIHIDVSSLFHIQFILKSYNGIKFSNVLLTLIALNQFNSDMQKKITYSIHIKIVNDFKALFKRIVVFQESYKIFRKNVTPRFWNVIKCQEKHNYKDGRITKIVQQRKFKSEKCFLREKNFL